MLSYPEAITYSLIIPNKIHNQLKLVLIKSFLVCLDSRPVTKHPLQSLIQDSSTRTTSDPLLKRQRGSGNSTKRTIPTISISLGAARMASLALAQEVRRMHIRRVRSATASLTIRASTWTLATVEELGPHWQMDTTLILQVGCRKPSQ